MIDFLMISTRSPKKGIVEIYPKFIIKKSSDLMIRGGDFYAVWVEERGMWSTDEQDALQMIDSELKLYFEKNKDGFGEMTVRVLYMWDSNSGMIDCWHKYCQKQMRDSFNMLDEKIIFSNDPVNKKDFASKRLPYPLAKGDISAYDKLIGTLYSPEERHKLEWAIGSVVSGDSKTIQKFLVLYGEAGTGKSTVLNIVQKLFDGYCAVFDAKALGSSTNAFALEAFRDNPLVAIQHDGDLSHIEDNTRLNSLVSHEMMTVNEKFKSTYSNRFKAFLFMGTNKPVKITDARSGLIRRLIDVTPSGDKVPAAEYRRLVKQIDFELGAIAQHCLDVYNAAPDFYDNYIPLSMMSASNDFYNYIIDGWSVFIEDDGITLKSAWERYKVYCDEAKVNYPMSQRIFKEELKNYFREYFERYTFEDGSRVRSYYKGFRREKFEEGKCEKSAEQKSWIRFDSDISPLDENLADCPAQYAENDIPTRKWENVKQTLSVLDTHQTHYVKPPVNHIVIDFDIPENGEKSLPRNIEAASKFPPTYAELSKSGAGIHLHYIYDGDVNLLSRVFGEHIEVKTFTGGSSLRRRLTKCNDIPVAHINSGLPLRKDVKKTIDEKVITNEKALRTLIKRNLNKEYHDSTKCSVDFINKALNDIYESGAAYDVSDLQNDILAFAAQSTNQADYCIKLVSKMKFKSDEVGVPQKNDGKLIFYDVEVFPNLFLVNWKRQGEDKVVRMINPKPAEIEELIKYNLVGFNCRRYDNHILYARLMGYSNEQLYSLSQKIITEGKGFFGEAYNLSYTDVYDFAAKKQSLKKWEIELGIHHQELGLPWDKPVPEELWTKVAEYCDNDVIATETVFDHLKADFTAREILADVAGMSVNDTTNSLTTRIIFGSNKHPQDRFNYRFMGKTTHEMGHLSIGPMNDPMDPGVCFDLRGQPWFWGYEFKNGKSTIRGEEVGEGGYVYAEPGIYSDVALLDIASMHPSSIVAENLFGDEYTARFKEILDARIAIKHRDFDKARTMLGGALAKYLDDESVAADLAQALKIAINSVYGLTSAKFDNPFRDIRNVDNIVAKRGALFMIALKHQVQKRGFTVAHIKTDSIKIPNATPEIISFVTEYGKKFGYNFEHEATYDRMCLVNDAVYIAKYKDGKWTATGTQFQVPYVFKTLFSKEDIHFEDMCETKSVSTALYLDMNEGLPAVSAYEKEHAELWKDICDMSIPQDDEMKRKCDRADKLSELIAQGHNYRFIGKVGQFCPMMRGGGELLREKDGKYSAVTGTKGYKWLESEMVKTLGKEGDIDRSYYDTLVDKAVAEISKYGDFEVFVSDDPLPNPKKQTGEWPPGNVTPWGMPCGREVCTGCEHFIDEQHDVRCALGHDPYPF